jgi:hypothetical protein
VNQHVTFPIHSFGVFNLALRFTINLDIATYHLADFKGPINRLDHSFGHIAADRTRKPQKIKKKKRIPSTIDIVVPDQAIVHTQITQITIKSCQKPKVAHTD